MGSLKLVFGIFVIVAVDISDCRVGTALFLELPV